MKRLIPILLVALSLTACLKEDTWCPVMYVSFKLEDKFLEGDFDSRVGHDVLLYIFQNDILTYSQLIPYESIAGGAEYAILKKPEILGNLKLVAWAVKKDISDQRNGGEPLEIHDERHPEYLMGSRFDAQYITKSFFESRADGDIYSPIHHERYIGVLDPIEDERWDRDSHHDIIMRPAPGRVVVNITDPGNYLGKTEGEPHIILGGVMSHMNLYRQGFGNQVSVRTPLGETFATARAEGEPTHTTDIFGVLPSQPGQIISVDIMNGNDKLQTLTVRTDDNLHQGIESGELLEFDYVLTSSEFTVTVGAWTQKIYIVDGM